MCQTSNTQVLWQYTFEYPDKKLEDWFQDYLFNTNFLKIFICDFEKAFDCSKIQKYFVWANTDI